LRILFGCKLLALSAEAVAKADVSCPLNKGGNFRNGDYKLQ
jgi:hypothetical protein